MPQMEVLSKTEHADLKLKSGLNVEALKTQNVIPLTATEFGAAGANFPVLFVQDDQSGEYRAVGVTGLKNGENLIFNDEINSRYIPFDLRRGPFAVVRDEENDRLVLCVDLESNLLDRVEGELIIQEDGSLSQSAETIQQQLQLYIQQQQVTNGMLRYLDELNLIIPSPVTITLDGEKTGLNGLYRIDDKALEALSDEAVLELHKRNYFSAIYAHLHSLAQMQHLVNLSAR